MVSRTFDWIPRHDPRSRSFGVTETSRPKGRAWWVPGPLDQGAEGACVGFGWVHEAMGTPVRVRGLSEASARKVYREAQKIDEWAGEAYEGTSVLAGAKVMQKAGYLKEYRWAFSIEQVMVAIGNTGPVVLGIPWYSGMYSAPGGILTPHGQIVGGHCIIAHAYRAAGVIFPDEEAVSLFNSWGPEWGTFGRAWIRKSHLAKLLQDDGEACVPFRRSYSGAL